VIDDFGYINARVRALKGLLLTARGYEEALGSASLEELVSYLESTPYATALGEAMTLKKGIAGVEEGLRRDFHRTIEHLVRIAGGRPRELLATVLGRWELFNVKTVLRGLHAGAGLEAIMGSAIPFGRLDEVALQELVRQADVRSAIDLLVQWRIPYAAALRAAYPAYREHGDFHALEVALDRSFFTTALRGLDRGQADEAVVAECLSREIDLILLSYALRAVHHGATEPHAGETFIPGGRTVTREVFEKLCAARTLGEFMAAVPSSSYTACLEEKVRRYLEFRRLFALERALSTCFIRGMVRLMLRDPLSIAFTIGYLWRKVNEITNLRLIARGKYAVLPREEIEALMFSTE
jgi:V/A-type H+-transporting ATPase subunit C